MADNGWTDVEEKEGEWKDVEPSNPEAAQAANPTASAPPIKPMQTGAFGEQVAPLTTKQSNEGNTGAAAGVMGATAVLNPMAAARGVVKSFGASQVGKYGGRWAGHLIGGEEGAKTGEEWGERGGAVVGPFLGGKTIARMPFVGRYLSTPEDYAAVQTERKLAQRASDIKGGLITPAQAKVPDPYAEKLPLPQRAYAEMESDIARRGEAPAPLPMRAHAEMESDIAAERQARAAANAEMEQEHAEGHQFRVGAVNEMNRDITAGRQERAGAYSKMGEDIAAERQARAGGYNEMNRDIAAERQGRAGSRQEMYQDLAAARNARNEEIPPADLAVIRNPGPIPPRANAPAWKSAVPEAAPPPPARTPIPPQEPPWAARAARVRANPQPAGEVAPTAPGTPGAAIPATAPAPSGDRATLEAARAAAEARAAGPFGMSREAWLGLSDEEKARAAAEWEMSKQRASVGGTIYAGRNANPDPYYSNENIRIKGRKR